MERRSADRLTCIPSAVRLLLHCGAFTIGTYAIPEVGRMTDVRGGGDTGHDRRRHQKTKAHWISPMPASPTATMTTVSACVS